MTKILFAASEAVPFIKTGGLADVVGSLPKYLDKDNYDVRVIVPRYTCMDDNLKKILRFHSHFYVSLGWRRQYAGILTVQYENVIYYFVDNEYYFSGDRPYNNIYEDVEKFAFFSRAVLDALPVINFCPDIIHCHDWQTGLIPVYLKNLYDDQPFYKNIKTIFSIHNMKFQGRWKLNAAVDTTGLPEELFRSGIGGLEAYGEVNYLKGGILFSDIVTTVSPTYANEIQTPAGGEGLDGLMRMRSGSLYGILNGIDYELYDPATDPHMAKHFGTLDFVPGKKANKAALQEMLHLPKREDVFLISMVSRLTNQKGFDLVAYDLEEILGKDPVQIVVLGTGEEKYEKMLRYFANRYPDKLVVSTDYAEALAHKIYASSDAFLTPSLFEPCGLSQLMSMRYGTVPMVRETGGLKDTVEAYNEYENTGNGFSFCNFNAQEMADMIHYAMHVYFDDRTHWNEMAVRCMEMDYSWANSAKEYGKIYEQLSGMR